MTAKDYLMEELRLRRELLEEMGRMAELLRRVVNEFDGEQERYWDLQDRICLLALAVPDPLERRVLFHRYFCGMSWRQVGAKLGISESAARRRHEAALKHMSMPDMQ